ncbi:uncharacterized protein LOC125420916 [Ziziphus jujuba]|uniref:Uncharacterized protein LOC125420916 n=1 Tax=Ziziphus jujuba TaxID=326968 RepID=A0ABM3IAF7_ZIZJJ|nr:uncharacterized protein LOC125420916 [Ziziphus jujuba]
MQQRFTTGYSSRVPDEERGLKSPETRQPTLLIKHSPRPPRVLDDGDDALDLPVYDMRFDIEKREISQSRSKKLIHAVPLLLFLCFFILWWFSYPVNLVIKDGRIMSIQPIEMEQPLNNSITHIDLGIVAAAVSPPLPSIPQNFTGNNAAEIISGKEKE